MKARRIARPLVTATFGLTLCGPGAALGQQVGADIGPYDPLGIRAGSFFIFPSLSVGEMYDDNIFAEDDDETDDFITNIAPEVRVESNFSRHQLGFRVGSDIGMYASNNDENYQDVFGVADGRLDITRSSILEGAINAGLFKEARDDPEDRAPTDEITEVWRYGTRLSYLQLFNRVNFRVIGQARRSDYEDAGEVNNDDRDNTIVSGTLRTGYYVSPRVNVFTQGRYAVERRDETPDDAGVDRDRDEWAVSAGAEVDLTNLLSGEFFFGYVRELPEDDDLDDDAGIDYGIDLTWLPTRLTTVTVGGTGGFESTGVAGAESRFRNTIGVGVRHELRRNILIGANADYLRDEFSGIERTDDRINLGASISYLLNRNLSIDGGYRFQNRWSDEPEDEFTRNIVRVGVTARL